MASPFDPTRPFALLWDREIGAARLFTDPIERIEAADIAEGLLALRRATDAGHWVAGGLSYEAGHGLEPRLAGRERGAPFLRFDRHRAPALLPADELRRLLAPHAAPVAIGAARPLVAREAWLAAVRQVQAYIAAGDIYQANLTFPAEVPVRGHPLALFARLFNPAAAPHGGLVHDGAGGWWLSLSPELFFTLADGTLVAQPMKGTAPRAPGAEADRAAAQALAADSKNRAENLMITDLIRNDLARVAVAGSVKVPRLFEVESFPTVHQMTSTVTAALAPGHDALDVLGALFPCGSITGAPKLRAMEIIAELEPHPRGLYCGSLGWIGPGAATARFNVAIRTLQAAGGTARLGLGSGIVADSVPEAEWAECLLKARFLAPASPATLIETMRIEAGGVIPRRQLHLARLGRSAARFGFVLDPPALEARLSALRPPGPRRLRLLLAADGAVALQLSPLPETPAGPVRAALVPLPVDPGDWRLTHKTGDRAFYDEARLASGAFECLFMRPDGLLTEGSFTSLFVERDGMLLTPPTRLGLLPGVLRAELLASGRAAEAELRADDLRAGFLIGNSLRGLLPARLAAGAHGR
jgi:para-aminobenzoate synthetase/4-amino-4-deoxychorismate lyase